MKTHMDLEDLEPGTVFRFADTEVIPVLPLAGLVEYYGHGWYGKPYDRGVRTSCEPNRQPRQVIVASDSERHLYNEHVIKLHSQHEKWDQDHPWSMTQNYVIKPTQRENALSKFD